jgi:hypothetical protein
MQIGLLVQLILEYDPKAGSLRSLVITGKWYTGGEDNFDLQFTADNWWSGLYTGARYSKKQKMHIQKAREFFA